MCEKLEYIKNRRWSGENLKKYVQNVIFKDYEIMVK